MTSKLPFVPRTPCLAGQRRGFTLVELMIAVAVVGILMAIAYPSFMEQVRKSRRAEAFTSLAYLQQAQERWRGNHSDYGALADLPGVSASTPNGYYGIEVTVSVDPDQPGYTGIATAQGSQASDGTCKLLAVRMTRGNISYGSGTADMDWTDPSRCWAR